MKVSLETKTDANPVKVAVECNESWTEVVHFDKAIDTLKLARAWFVKQKASK